MHLDGGSSNYILVDHPRYLVEYEPLPTPFAATLGCSGPTAFSALKKSAPVDAQNRLLVIGAGGLGLAATGLARALYGVSPVVADVDAAKRQTALDAGASGVADPGDPGERERLMKEIGGASSVIDFVGAESSAAIGLSVPRKGGRMFVVGLFGGSIAIPLATLPLRAISIGGVATGTLDESREFMAFAREGKCEARADRDKAAAGGATIARRSPRRTNSRPRGSRSMRHRGRRNCSGG